MSWTVFVIVLPDVATADCTLKNLT